jgi:hypothetical protein
MKDWKSTKKWHRPKFGVGPQYQKYQIYEIHDPKNEEKRLEGLEQANLSVVLGEKEKLLT